MELSEQDVQRFLCCQHSWSSSLVVGWLICNYCGFHAVCPACVPTIPEKVCKAWCVKHWEAFPQGRWVQVWRL